MSCRRQRRQRASASLPTARHSFRSSIPTSAAAPCARRRGWSIPMRAWTRSSSWEVPPQLSLAAGLEREEKAAREVLEAARLRARDDKLKIRTAVVRARSAGAAIVDEARRRNAEVVYLDLPRGLSAVASYVLEKRPCRVVIETMGGGARPYPSGDAAQDSDRNRPGRVRDRVGAR